MKVFLLNSFFVILFLISCKENQESKVVETSEKVVLQLQPFKDIKADDVENIASQIQKIYPNVEILLPIDFPENSYYQPRNRYRADSIIKFLSSQTKPNFVKVGLTTKDISTTKGNVKDFGIMGLGYRPGKACVASSFRLDASKRKEQFYKIIIHEIGHTQGLKHCPEKTCFMRDAEGGNPTDDETDFCEKCKDYLKTKHWKFN
ncbi:Zn-dependent protease [Epilithonimonas xixisoli]|uniref:Archaemetzincin n=1 Tax=Epilithonimonas xixisoli TaxID=1476462 RepID=A0A4R8I7T8_9FLAO|nr:Zn-dependent protease [Epilithonimonas xixisoli]TDX86058.1 archaemetzincin [Epilithonimonas xixisoli]